MTPLSEQSESDAMEAGNVNKLEALEKHDSLAITAVIPAYNEESEIRRVVQRAKDYAREVVVVDDGSTDSTASTAAGAGAIVLRHEQNLGYGNALATGFGYVRENGADAIVVLDGDGQHDPSDIPKLLDPIIREEADIVIGSRFMFPYAKSLVPAYRRAGITVVNRIWNFVTFRSLTDTQSGFRAYSRGALDRIRITEPGMSASLEILDQALLERLTIREIPILVNYKDIKSTIMPLRHGIELLLYMTRRRNVTGTLKSSKNVQEEDTRDMTSKPTRTKVL